MNVLSLKCWKKKIYTLLPQSKRAITSAEMKITTGEFKYLVSTLDTEEDIKQRKWLVLYGTRWLSSLFNSKHIREKNLCEFPKRMGKAVFFFFFLYNSEPWRLSRNYNLHRRLLRYIIRVKWRRVISNERLYQKLSSRVQSFLNEVCLALVTFFGYHPILRSHKYSLNSSNQLNFIQEDQKLHS